MSESKLVVMFSYLQTLPTNQTLTFVGGEFFPLLKFFKFLYIQHFSETLTFIYFQFSTYSGILKADFIRFYKK